MTEHPNLRITPLSTHMNTQTDDLIKPTLSRTYTPTLSNLWFKAIKTNELNEKEQKRGFYWISLMPQRHHSI